MGMSPSVGRFTLHLAKEDFKFSCAHFTLFGAEDAETLHGHNYQVTADLEGSELDEVGLLADLVVAKKRIRASCERLDSLTLIPTLSPYLKITQADGGVEVLYCERRYLLPAEDVLTLELANTSIELLAQMLWRELAEVLVDTQVEVLTVNVGETAGQSCSYRAALD